MTRDVNMSVILGRPGGMDRRNGFPSLPVDVAEPSDPSRTPITPRDPSKDPPTPIIRMLWLWKMTEPLCQILDMEKEGPFPKDVSKIDRIHDNIFAIDEIKPPVLRLENPDTRWDHYPNMGWLKPTRFYMAQLNSFNLMALHRPYTFNRAESREEALRASLMMLEMQVLSFKGLHPASWRK